MLKRGEVVKGSTMKFMSVVKRALAAFVIFTSLNAHAAIIYSDQADFEATLGNSFIDDYSDDAYRRGDEVNASTFDSFSNAAISAIMGETVYRSTGFDDMNFIVGQLAGDYAYCAGCNGSFLLDFTSTSVGTDTGVFGVGLSIYGEERVFGTIAFVTFGDGSTSNFVLPAAVEGESPFWGITSSALISSIHFGLEDGQTTTSSRMALDSLIIGSASDIPEPSTLFLSLLAGGLLLARRRA